MRRIAMLGAVVVLGLLALLPAVAAGQDLGPPPEADGGGGLGGFHGFSSFDAHAQSHVASLVGYLNAFREENRLVGALSEVNGPPANSRNISAIFQRGPGATFVYGVIGGGGGERGKLPDPPPGEANAFYPTDPPEMTFQGPVTAVVGQGETRTLDGRAYAKATPIPTGRSDAALSHFDVPGYFTADVASAASRTEPAKGGVEAESVSVVRGLTAGPLRIESLVSSAYAFISASDSDPQGTATTVVEGATVNGTPVKITDKGVVVDKNTSPGAQSQVNAALVQAGFKEVRLTPSTATAGPDKQSVKAAAGTLSFVQYDENFGASNPQGFSGGGWTVGGAETKVSGRRCAPDCPGGASEASGTVGELPPDTTAAPPGEGSSYGADSSYATPPASSGYTGSPVVSSTYELRPSSAAAGIGTRAPAGAALGDLGSFGGSASADLYSGSSGYTTDSTPEAAAPAPVAGERPAEAAPAATPKSPSSLDVTLTSKTLGPKSADWLRDGYLALGAAAGLVLIGQRLVKAL